MVRKILSLMVVFCLFSEQCFAQFAPFVHQPQPLPLPSVETSRPAQLRSLIFNPASGDFDILLDKGGNRAGGGEAREAAARLMNYFQVGISLSDDTFWVNLRPDGAERIIDPALENTDLGRILLEADVALKKDLAKACSPDTREGKRYWDKLHAKAQALFGDSSASIPTLSRPWIVPGEIIVRQSAQSVYLYKAMLKVRLEQDRLGGSWPYSFTDPRMKELNTYASSLIRELILPGLSRTVNSSQSYASLRQVYYSLILAQWFKKHFRGSAAEFAGRIDSGDLTGLTSSVRWSKETYFETYRRSFNEGEYTIRKNHNSLNGAAVRSYSSGGFVMTPGIFEGALGDELSTVNGAPQPLVTPEGVSRFSADTLSPVGTDFAPVQNVAVKKDGGVDISTWIAAPFKPSDLNPDMFRDYDYRSTGFELNPRMGFLFGLQWGRMALKKAKKAGIANRKVVIARDARKIEPELVEAISDALRYMGFDVIYTAAEGPNCVTSYSWSLQQHRPLMGIFVTASHVSRPKGEKVRGFKVAMLTRNDRGVQSMTTREIKDTSKAGIIELMNDPALIQRLKGAAEGTFTTDNVDTNCVRMNALVGKVAKKGLLYDFGRQMERGDPVKMLSAWEALYGNLKPLSAMKIVVEGANTPSGAIAARTYNQLGADVIVLNAEVKEVEGEHNADPSIEKNLLGLQAAIKERGADMGIAFDLDGDRGAVVIPVIDPATGTVRFETIAPDNMMVSLLPSFLKWGYDPNKTNKKIGVIRDVLGTFAVNEKAETVVGSATAGIEVFQTDAGYVFLKARLEQLLDQGYAVPIYGERSGHCWLDVTGVIENPVAVSVLFAVMVKEQLKYGERNPVYSAYSRTIIPYLQSPRFQPAFHPMLLKKLSSHPGNTFGWVFDPSSSKNPSQAIIALGKDEGIKALSGAFAEGTPFAGGQIKVAKFNSYKDVPEEGGLYRFADIVFSDNRDDFCGRFVFRASSNDPTFVCSYEAPERGDKAQAEKNLMMVGGSVLDWLEKNGFALVSAAAMGRELGLDAAQASEKSKKLNLSSPEQHMTRYRIAFDGGAVTPGQLAVEMDYIMRMLGIKDYPRITETIKRSVNPVQFVNTLAVLSERSPEQVLAAFNAIDSFKPMGAVYRVLTTGSFDPREFALKKISMTVNADGYTFAGARTQLPGQPLSDYLTVMRSLASTVPFVFRDDMEAFVSRFLGDQSARPVSPDLRDLIDTLIPFLKGRDLGTIKYIVSSGIGANEMYSHQLARILNEAFMAMGIDVQWIVVNNPAHLNKIPADADNGNTIVFEMSRSGTTKETVDFQNATIEDFTQRVVAANSGLLKEQGLKLQERGTGLVIDNTPGDIGGRQMNRKTLMVYVPLFIACCVGTKDTGKAQDLLGYYVSALLKANNSLGYSKGTASEAIALAEALYLQRTAGRNKWSVIFDESLRPESKALIQLNNEGANKIGAAGSNDNILDSYSWQADQPRFDKVFQNAPDTQLPIFLLNSNSRDYDKQQEYIAKLQAQGIPAIVISVELGDLLGRNLATMARTTALLQDMVVYFTYITNQDANSNPAVKMVREITAAMFEILKEKKKTGDTDISISFRDVTVKLAEKQRAGREKAAATITGKNAQKKDGNEFPAFVNDIKKAAEVLELPDVAVSETLLQTISAEVFKADVGEAGGNNSREIEEAFGRSAIGAKLGLLSPGQALAPLDQQVVLLSDPGTRISVAANSAIRFDMTNDMSHTLAQYLFAIYKQRKAQWRYLTLTYMEADNENPLIKTMAQNVIDEFSDMNITAPLLALPGVAHTGIEAIMSHPESIINIAVVYTNTYGEGLGTREIEAGVTVDDATYVYGISNVIRMALAGTPNIIFEIRNKEQLPGARIAVRDALAQFKRMIKGEAAFAAARRDGGKGDPDMGGNDVKGKNFSSDDGVGGIDFKQLAAGETPVFSSRESDRVAMTMQQMEAVWKEIRFDIMKGTVPVLKMTTYIGACFRRNDIARMKAVATCIDEIIKRDEEAARPTRPEVVTDILPLLG